MNNERRCVRRLEGSAETWCGKTEIPIGDWTFVDPTHAALSGAKGSCIEACPECIIAIIKALTNTVGDIN